jgi:hypothetical protein
MRSSGTAPSSLTIVASTVSIGGCADRSSGSTPSPRSGTTVRTALIRYVQNTVGSRSLCSRDSHAADLFRTARCSHAATEVVLPNPAGAETSVSFVSAPSSRRSLNRERGTTPRRRRGMKSLVRTRGLAMAAPLTTSSRMRPRAYPADRGKQARRMLPYRNQVRSCLHLASATVVVGSPPQRVTTDDGGGSWWVR